MSGDDRLLWPERAWYVAAASDEIRDRPLGRRICGKDIVLYRGSEGQVTALEDFCPHRGAPLSLGFIRDGDLVCGYHGLSIASCGRVAAMPNQRVGRFPRVLRFPVRERGGFVWLWPGPPDLAETAALPELAWTDASRWTFAGGYYHVASDYRLMIDNLMDLTHETYVHATSIGQKEIDEAPVRTRVEGTEVVTSRLMTGIHAPPFWKLALEGAGLPSDQLVDRWQRCRFSPPSHVMIEVGVALAGEGGYEAPDDRKVSSIVVDFMTPETENSHHYFWGMARRFALDDDSLTEKIRAGQQSIFQEDLTVLERQQKNLVAHPEKYLLLLNIDAGGARARQMIEKAIDREIADIALQG